ncbi:MAG TPA: HD domain-containing phosphohydrolase [Gemmatimonadaceae bacterium]|nr:HD domain-containing phosphohydrolase [Gemmatimonadaceae bacterium]
MIRHAPAVLLGAFGALYFRERRRRLRLERLGAATLETLLDAVDANNPDTGEHVRRVARYALILADAADLDYRMRRSVERVALFHDIGKIDGALHDIVNEKSRLTPSERQSIMIHPQRGAEVLQPLSAFYPDLAEGVLCHHERWDGSGYPRQLKETEIPLTARIVAIADTFDAVTHARAYSHARSAEIATSVIAEGRATQFDPDLADLFLSPPVMECVLIAMREVRGPKRSIKRRRGNTETQEVPDITFRWRTPAPSPQQAGR